MYLNKKKGLFKVKSIIYIIYNYRVDEDSKVDQEQPQYKNPKNK
jgi:hypothetical protein